MLAAGLDFRNHRLASLALAGLFVVATTLSLRAALDRFDELLHGRPVCGYELWSRIQTFKVDALDPQAEGAGLRKGDIVVAVNGRPVQGWSDIYGPVRRARTGDHLLLRVRRQRSRAPLRKTSRFRCDDLPTWATCRGRRGTLPRFVLILTPLFCLVLGFWVAAVRIRDRAAWTLLC